MNVNVEDSNLNVIKFVLDFIQLAFCHLLISLHTEYRLYFLSVSWIHAFINVVLFNSHFAVSFVHKKNVEKMERKTSPSKCVYILLHNYSKRPNTNDSKAHIRSQAAMNLHIVAWNAWLPASKPYRNHPSSVYLK